MVTNKQRTIPRACSSANGSLSRATEILDRTRHVARRRNPIGARDLHGGLRHSIDDGAVAVLYDRLAARGANASQTFRAVAPHSGEDHSNSVGAESVGGGDEKRISGGSHTPKNTGGNQVFYWVGG